jgi:hypothetical protein
LFDDDVGVSCVDRVGKNEDRISLRRTDGTCDGDRISVTG